VARHLLDTNVLLRVFAEDSDQHDMAMAAIAALKLNGGELCVTPQVLIECCCAGTRPRDVNGFGWDVSVALSRVRNLIAMFSMLDDSPEVFREWLPLVERHERKGKQVHDARLVAVMKAHGVENLLTFNVEDFAAYDEIKAVHPRDVK